MDLKKIIKENLSGKVSGKALRAKGANISEKFKNKAKNVGSGLINTADSFFDALSYNIVKRSVKNKPTNNVKPVTNNKNYNNLKPKEDTTQPFYTNLTEGQNKLLKKGDSVADILAKMLNFMKKVHEEEIKEMELSRNLSRKNKYVPITKEKSQGTFSRLQKEDEDDNSFLKKLLLGLAAAALAIAGVYAALKGLLDPFINIFNNIRIPDLAALPVFNPFSRIPSTSGNSGRGKVNPNEHDEEERKKLEKQKNDKNKKTPKPPGKVPVSNASGENLPAEEPQKPTPSKTPQQNKPGFLDTAEDKIKKRALRIAAASKELGKNKLGGKITGALLKQGAKRFALGLVDAPLTIALSVYDIADALAPEEEEALNTDVDTLLSMKEDMKELERKHDAKEIPDKQYNIAMEGMALKAKTIQQRIEVLKKKAEDETYRMEAQLNEQSAEDGITTLADEVKGMGRDTATAVHSITKPIENLGKRAAINQKNNTQGYAYDDYMKAHPKATFKEFTRHRWDELTNKSLKDLLDIQNENNDLKLKSMNSGKVASIDNSKTNNIGGGNNGGVVFTESVNVRDSTLNKYGNTRFA
jgi:hypothetical protein